jgi:hypothetical protein
MLSMKNIYFVSHSSLHFKFHQNLQNYFPSRSHAFMQSTLERERAKNNWRQWAIPNILLPTKDSSNWKSHQTNKKNSFTFLFLYADCVCSSSHSLSCRLICINIRMKILYYCPFLMVVYMSESSYQMYFLPYICLYALHDFTTIKSAQTNTK